MQSKQLLELKLVFYYFLMLVRPWCFNTKLQVETEENGSTWLQYYCSCKIVKLHVLVCIGNLFDDILVDCLIWISTITQTFLNFFTDDYLVCISLQYCCIIYMQWFIQRYFFFLSWRWDCRFFIYCGCFVGCLLLFFRDFLVFVYSFCMILLLLIFPGR